MLSIMLVDHSLKHAILSPGPFSVHLRLPVCMKQDSFISFKTFPFIQGSSLLTSLGFYLNPSWISVQRNSSVFSRGLATPQEALSVCNDSQQVAKGQYVVSDTRCSALSDCELEWGEAEQRPQRGQSPVEHRRDFCSYFYNGDKAASSLSIVLPSPK